MDMAAVIDEMVPAPPASPGPGQSTALEQPPEVMKEVRVKNRGVKRCLEPSFARPPSRSPSPPPAMSPPALLSPRRVTLQTGFGDRPLRAEAGQDKGKDKAEADNAAGAAGGVAAAAASAAAAAHERPSKLLRMQMRRASKGLNGGSSTHNAAPLQRTLSVYVPFSPPADVAADAHAMDAETLFAQSNLCGLRTPPRACRLEVDIKDLSPLKGLNLDLDFEQFEQFHMSD